MTTLERVLPPEPVVSRARAGIATQRRSPGSPLRTLLVAVDAAAVAVAWAAGFVVGRGELTTTSFPVVLAAIVAVTALTIAALATQRLYRARDCTIRSVEILGIGRSVALAAIAAVLFARYLPLVHLTPEQVVTGGVLAFVGVTVGRAGYRSWLQAQRKSGRFTRTVVVIGANDEGQQLCRLLGDHPELGFRVRGVIGDLEKDADPLPVPHLSRLADAVATIESLGSTGVVIAASAVPPADLNRLVRVFLARGIHVHLSSGIRGINHRRVRSQPLAHEPLFYLEPLELAPWQLTVKRAIDLAGGIAALVLTAPVLAVAALLVKLHDRGPVLFRQTRVGRDGRPFTCIKLRTMELDAEARYHALVEGNAGRDGPLIKLAHDPRVTPIGRILRVTSIDELPQLFNVLRGEMSLVGPRPAQPSEVARFDDELQMRHAVRPGISGLWQVEARDNPSFAAYKRYDLFYIENWSVSLDLAILVVTIERVLFRSLGLLSPKRLLGRRGVPSVVID